MGHILNHSHFTTDSSDETILVSFDSEDVAAPIPNFLITQVNLNSLHVPKPSFDELVLQFEAEANDLRRSLMQACKNYVNSAESDAI